MDYVSHFRREVQAFEAAARRAAEAERAPLVPSCPDWSVTDLVGHLGGVQRFVAHIVRERLQQPPDTVANLIARTPSADLDVGFLALPADRSGWPESPEGAPHREPVPASLIDWFADGAAALAEQFTSAGPDVPVWTFGEERTTGFWQRIQAIEAAVHRWDAESALGAPRPFAADLAEDVVTHTFEVMAPARRAWTQAPPGAGERFRFRRTDGTRGWTVHFEGAEVRLTDGTGPYDVELAGTASDLALFLWQRLPADRLEVTGDRKVLDRYFTLVPPV
ncbi:maleylpyruvate isomerase family mycothiol-dependent enzyme [Streptomyces sp. URMC 123]|uniref:maleylpyruvate isomerase family mycothiol-dependent enzyme n=1 Tax=Streptomyces sp. URMC 123 TaxID=3423403 RepID=UPI003F1A4EDE